MNLNIQNEEREDEMDDEEKLALSKGRENFKKGNFLTIEEMRDKLKMSR